MIYVTGDKHGSFIDIERFCERVHPSKNDIMIILGDVGVNYYGDKRDVKAKKRLSSLPLTFFCVHGNHENRPENVPNKYHTQFFHGGQTLVEDEFPNIKFALDGEIYNFNGLSTMVIGGAYSVDKHYRLENGWPWFSDEQPSDVIKEYIGHVLDFNNRNIDVFLSHTCPYSCIPTEMFLPMIDQSTVDNSTEKFLETIATTCTWKKWFCGHYHTNKRSEVNRNVQFLFEDIIEFPVSEIR